MSWIEVGHQRDPGDKVVMPTAGIVIVGNEVLSGRVEEQNARYLCRELRGEGVSLERVTFVPDDVRAIASDVAQMAGRFDFVLTTGGIGSTHDDVTLEGIARALGVPLQTEPYLESRLRAFFQERYDASIARMARLPEGAELIGREGKRYPLVRVRNVFAFPGVPRFLREKFDLLRPLLNGQPFCLRHVFLSVTEDRVATLLWSLVPDHPNVQIGSYPKFEEHEDHRVELTVEGRDREQVDAAFQALLREIDPAWVVRSA